MTVLLRDLLEPCEVEQVLLVREVELRRQRDGSAYLQLTVADRSGALPAVLWDASAELVELAQPGRLVHVCGRYSVHARYGPQLVIGALNAADGHVVALEDLLDGPDRPAQSLEADLRDLVSTIQNRHLRELLERLLGDGSEGWARYRVAPAAKYYHQAYQHGLLEHSLGVAQAVSALASTFGPVDRDIAVAGALLHDIGKLEAYTAEGLAIDLTDAGRLQGEIALGYYRIRRAVEDIRDFPGELAQALLHIILSHHGTLAHGSPVVPCTREATLVHHCDNLGGRLGSFDRIEKETPQGQRWSGYDRAIGTGAYFSERSAPVEQQAAASARRTAA